MKLLRRSALMAISVAAFPVQAQNPIADLGGSTYREKTTYAVYDLRGTDLKAEAIESVVLDAMRTYARDAQVRQSIPPLPYPAYPNQMTIGQRHSGGPKPDCAGELFSIEAIDASMAKYGEKTYHRACLFPYAGGYRINYFAIYGQQSGVGNANPNVLAAMLGRAMGSVVGLGDSSAAINKLLGRIESGLQGASIGFRLVQLHPKDLPGRTLVDDDLPRPAAQAAANADATPAPTPSAASVVAVSPGQAPDARAVPPALAQLQAALLQQREAARQQLAARQAAPQGQSKRLSAADARKELAAMGLQYFNQDQFVAAIHRGDNLAVDLFITGAGIDLNAAGPGGTPLAVAENSGRPEIAALLKTNGAR